MMNFTYNQNKQVSILGQAGLRFLNESCPLVLYYAQTYKLPIVKGAYYLYMNGCIATVKYHDNGIWWTDIAAHPNVRGKKAIKTFKSMLNVFSLLFYVKGYFGLIEKNNKAARLNARFCGYREFSDIVINYTEYKLYIRSF